MRNMDGKRFTYDEVFESLVCIILLMVMVFLVIMTIKLVLI